MTCGHFLHEKNYQVCLFTYFLAKYSANTHTHTDTQIVHSGHRSWWKRLCAYLQIGYWANTTFNELSTLAIKPSPPANIRDGENLIYLFRWKNTFLSFALFISFALRFSNAIYFSWHTHCNCELKGLCECSIDICTDTFSTIRLFNPLILSFVKHMTCISFSALSIPKFHSYDTHIHFILRRIRSCSFCCCPFSFKFSLHYLKFPRQTLFYSHYPSAPQLQGQSSEHFLDQSRFTRFQCESL